MIDKEKKKMQVISSGSEILQFNKQYTRHNKFEILINSLDFWGEMDFLVASPHLGAKISVPGP